MYALPTSNHLLRSLRINKFRLLPLVAVKPISHKDRIKQDLKNLGVSWYGLSRREGRYLYKIIHPDERIGGVIYGHHKDGYVMLVATNLRVIFLDIKPLFINKDEIDYHVVSGVKISRAGIGTTLTLHTRIKDYPIRTFNHRCTESFVSYIESRSLEHDFKKENSFDRIFKKWFI